MKHVSLRGPVQLSQASVLTLYVLMFAGGLWQMLGLLQSTMAVLAGPLLITVAAWTVFEVERHGLGSVGIRIWMVLVLVISLACEWIGVQTGAVFGEYSYGLVLQPQILGVPLAIGFAWLSTFVGAFALVQRFLPSLAIWWRILLIAAIMTLFDVALEFVAIKLNYWTWSGGTPPLQNYIAWFVLGCIFGITARLFGFFDRKNLPATLLHILPAQALYFVMVLLRP